MAFLRPKRFCFARIVVVIASGGSCPRSSSVRSVWRVAVQHMFSLISDLLKYHMSHMFNKYSGRIVPGDTALTLVWRTRNCSDVTTSGCRLFSVGAFVRHVCGRIRISPSASATFDQHWHSRRDFRPTVAVEFIRSYGPCCWIGLFCFAFFCVAILFLMLFCFISRLYRCALVGEQRRAWREVRILMDGGFWAGGICLLPVGASRAGARRFFEEIGNSSNSSGDAIGSL